MYHLKLCTNDMKREWDYESEGTHAAAAAAMLSRPSGPFTFLQSCRQTEGGDGGGAGAGLGG